MMLAEEARTMKLLCKSSFYEFFRESWPILEPTKELKLNWHLEYLADLVQDRVERVARGERKEKDLIINISPGTTKSTLMTQALPAWVWLLESSLKVLSSSYDAGLAITHANRSRTIIRSSWYQTMWGGEYQLKREINRLSEYANTKGGIRIASSVGGGTATGTHGDINIIDDPLDPRRAASDKEIQTTIDWYKHTWYNRVTEASTSLRILIMQRLREDDLSGYLLKHFPDKYEHVCFPAELSDHVKPVEAKKYYINGLFDPDRLSRETLDDYKVILGSLGYAGQYKQIPSSEAGNLANPKWFGRFSLAELELKARNERTELIWDFAVDGAFTENKMNAPTAIMSYAIIFNNLYIRDMVRVWMELPDLLRTLKDVVHRNGYTDQSRIFIEPKASGMPIEQVMRAETSLNVVLDKNPTKDKVVRFKSILPMLESLRCFLLEGSAWIDPYLDEIRNFPNSTYKDQVDVTVMGGQKLAKPQGQKVFRMRTF